MENINKEMENAAVVADDELNAVSGGGILDAIWNGLKGKNADEIVCPHCGHIISIKEDAEAKLPVTTISCEKCCRIISRNIINEGNIMRA